MKKIVWLGIVTMCISLYVSCVFAFDSSFSFSPASGTRMKLHCETPVYLMIDGGSEPFNGFAAHIKYNTTQVQIKTGVIHTDFKNGNNVVRGDLYDVGGAMLGGYKTGTLTGVSFSVVPLNGTSTQLFLVDKNGNNPEYGMGTTDDGISLAGENYSNNDILGSVQNTTYNFVALPCNADDKDPTITNLSVSSGATKVPSDKVITFVTYDWDSSNPVSHWFAGNSTGDLSNYVSADGQHVDNQEGVNSGSISVKVSCDTCSGSPSNVNATGNISDWNGESTKNALTWDSERRGYNVSFEPPFSYEVEKKVTVSISVSDNPNEFGATHTGTYNFSFNAPKSPEITMLEPSNTGFVSPNEDSFKFYISDDWAGVDTGTIVISIPQIEFSGEILLTGYIYSGSDLSFELINGSEGLGNAGSYNVTFSPKEDFPIKTTITISVSGADLAGNTVSKSFTFTTRPDCSFYGCRNATTIIGPGHIWEWVFTGNVLIVTGVNPDSVEYPKLSGDTLYCSDGEWTGLQFMGNIALYSGEESLGTSTWYDKNEVYVTGDDRLNIEYQDGKLVVTKQNN